MNFEEVALEFVMKVALFHSGSAFAACSLTFKTIQFEKF